MAPAAIENDWLYIVMPGDVGDLQYDDAVIPGLDGLVKMASIHTLHPPRKTAPLGDETTVTPEKRPPVFADSDGTAPL
ncbi:hypothetical protein A5692_12210 [Mycobacterium sp. E342]|nr:hypothetical protein A5692_12210 [Mycobacterium sp. E342]